MIAMMKDTEYMQKPTFLKNAWAALKEVLGKGHTIRSLEKCDFSPIFEWHLKKKEAEKARTKEVSPNDTFKPKKPQKPRGFRYSSFPYTVSGKELSTLRARKAPDLAYS